MSQKVNVDGIELDKEVVSVYKLLNSFPGVKTCASCSGHGYSDCYISFTCDNYESLKNIVDAVYKIRWNCGNNFNTKLHLWVINFIPGQWRNKALTLSIDWQEDITLRRNRRINLKAWDILHDSLSSIKAKD